MTLVYLAIAWQAGILAADLLWKQGLLGCSRPIWWLALPMLAALLAALISRRRATLALVFLCLAAFGLGSLRYHLQPLRPCFSPGDLAYLHRQSATSVTIEGVVVAYPVTNDTRASYRLAADTVLVGQSVEPVRGLALVQSGVYPSFRYGDRLRVTGRLKTPPIYEDFDYRSYLAQTNVHSLLQASAIEQLDANQGHALISALYGLRARASRIIRQSLSEPAAAMAEGILLGIDSGLSAELSQAFSITGATHILVISGSNIAVLCGILLSMLRPLAGLRRAAVLALIGVGLYVLLVGAEPPAFRAGIMAAVYLIGILAGRQSIGITTLALAAAILTAANPLVLWSASFQLSFVATLGLISLAPRLRAPLDKWVQRRIAPGTTRSIMASLVGIFSTTAAAQAAVLPLAAASFGVMPVLSLPVNLLILPVQSAVLGAGLVMVALGFVWLPLASIPAAMVWFLLTYSAAVVRVAAKAPFAAINIHGAGWTFPALSYAVILIVYLAHGQSQLRTRPVFWRGLASLGGLAVVACLAVLLLFRLPDRRLHLFYLPESAGAAALVITPNGHSLLVWDGQGDASALERSLERLPGGGTQLTVAIVPHGKQAPPAARTLDPSALPDGSELRIDAVSLRRPPGLGSVFELRHGNFRALLPLCPPALCQAAVQDTRGGSAITVLRTHPTDAGHTVWSAPWAQNTSLLVLWPEEQDQESSSLPGGIGVGLVAQDAAAEVTTDGQRFWLRQWYGG